VILWVGEYAAGVLVVIGALFSLIAAIGVLRLPDLYTRMHAATKVGTVGAGFILLGVAAAAFDASVVLRALIGIGFLVLTTPVSAHLLARAAFLTGTRPTWLTYINEAESETGDKPKY
jgi:multicomponent Na+:H+ antiporter subunit G